MTQDYVLTGTHCAACLKLCVSRLKRLEAISDIIPLDGPALRVVSTRHVGLDELAAALAGTGYGIETK